MCERVERRNRPLESIHINMHDEIGLIRVNNYMHICIDYCNTQTIPGTPAMRLWGFVSMLVHLLCYVVPFSVPLRNLTQYTLPALTEDDSEEKELVVV